MRSGGPTVGPGGARARARGGQDWGQGGPGLGPGGARAGARGGHGPPGPPAGYGPDCTRQKSYMSNSGHYTA